MHDIAAAWVARGLGGRVIHGWMAHKQSLNGWEFCAHSLVELGAQLLDVTYACDRHPFADPRFIPHPGVSRDFLALVTGPDGVPIIEVTRLPD